MGNETKGRKVKQKNLTPYMVTEHWPPPSEAPLLPCERLMSMGEPSFSIMKLTSVSGI